MWLWRNFDRLISISSDQSDEKIEVQESEASPAVLSALSALLPDSFKEVDVLLRALSRGILEGRAVDQQFLPTFVTHPYDNGQHTVLTSKNLTILELIAADVN